MYFYFMSFCMALLALVCLRVGSNFGHPNELNKKQLQLVADSIAPKVCRKLFAELIRNTSLRLEKHEAFLQKVHHQVTCFDMLTYWSILEEKVASFRTLADYLRYVEEDEVADRLSKSVFEEHVERLKTNFLFRDKPSSEVVSILAQEAPRYHQQRIIDESEGSIIGYRPLHILLYSTIVIMVFLASILSVLILVPMMCPATKRYMGQNFRSLGLI